MARPKCSDRQPQRCVLNTGGLNTSGHNTAEESTQLLLGVDVDRGHAQVRVP